MQKFKEIEQDLRDRIADLEQKVAFPQSECYQKLREDNLVLVERNAVLDEKYKKLRTKYDAMSGKICSYTRDAVLMQNSLIKELDEVQRARVILDASGSPARSATEKSSGAACSSEGNKDRSPAVSNATATKMMQCVATDSWQQQKGSTEELKLPGNQTETAKESKHEFVIVDGKGARMTTNVDIAKIQAGVDKYVRRKKMRTKSKKSVT